MHDVVIKAEIASDKKQQSELDTMKPAPKIDKTVI